MGDITFKAKFDTTEVNTGFEDIVDTTKATTKVVQTEAKKQSKAYNDERKKIKPIPEPVPAKAVNILRQLKKEANAYVTAANAAAKGSKEWADNLAKAGAKKGEINDLQSAIKSLDPDTKAAAFSNLAASGVDSLNGISGALALAGIEGENYQKILVRLQGVQAIATSIRSISGLSDQWTEAKLSLVSYISALEEKILADRISKAVVLEGTAEQLAASAKNVAAIEAEAAATAEATIATRILNLVKASTPWGAIAIGVTLVTTAIFAYVSASQAAKEADKIRNTATDGVIIKNKELREEYEKLLVAEKKLNIDLEVTSGRMSKLRGEIEKLKVDKFTAVNEANKELNATLAEQNTWYNAIVLASLAAATGQDINTLRLVRNADQVKKLRELKLVEDKKLADGTKEVEEKAARESLIHSREIEIERLKTKKAILEAGGKETFDIQKQIIDQEQNLADLQTTDELDAEGAQILNAEKAAQEKIAIDKAEGDARRAFRQQLNGLIISQMQEGHQKELTLLQENYRTEHETRQQFFDREEGSLKEKYNKDLATLAESQRTQREAILNDTSLSGGQKNALEKELTLSFDKQRLDLEIKFEDDKTKIEKEFDKKRFDESQKNLDAIAKQKQDNIQFTVDMIDAQGEIENAALKDQLNKKLISQTEYDKQVLANELEAIKRRRDATIAQDQLELDRLQEKLRAQQAIGEDDSETVKQADAAKKKLALDQLKFEGDIANKEVDINKDKNKLISDENKQHLQDTFDAVKNAADQIISQQEEQLNALKETIDASISENDRYLGVLTDQLRAEQDERAAGHANNVAGVEAQIEAEKKAREDNLADQKKVQAEQAKLAKIKLIEDKAMQASAIISAIANIYLNQSALGPIGVILASISAAAMLVAFAQFKKKVPGFAKGTKKAPAGLKWVGEEGPELINDKGGYRIFTNKESENIMRNYPRSIPEYDFTSNISNVLRPKDATDTKGIERRIDKSNELLEKGINKEKVLFSGDKKITYSGSTTNITRNYGRH